MKKILILTINLLLLLGILLPVYAFQNEPDGFRGLKWGDSPDKTSSLILVDQDKEGYVAYKNTQDILELKGAELKSIEYVFYNNKLVSVQIVGKYSDRLLNVLKSQFGDGIDISSIILKDRKYIWKGTKTTIEFWELSINSAILTIQSTEHFNQEDQQSGTGF